MATKASRKVGQDGDEESYLISQGPCQKCNSSDAASLYSSGWVKCFSCGANYKADGSVGPIQSRKVKMDLPMIEGEYTALTKRDISEDVCKKYHYRVGTVPSDYPVHSNSSIGKMRGKTVQIANFYDDDGALTGQVLRDAKKNFAIVGDVSNMLFGKHCVKSGQKELVITEGFIDCMSYAEARKNWPAVSIPNGAKSAKKAIAENIEWIETFDKVILCFDNDAEGKSAIEECKTLISPGKVFVGALPEEYKDLNEALVAGDIKSILHMVYNAEEVRPDGMVEVDDILEESLKPIEWGLPWFIPELTKLTYGRRYSECYALGAGTGVGKTDVFMEQAAFDITELDLTIGLFFLEQKPTETVKRLAGKIANRRFHVPDDGWTTDELREAVEKLRGKVCFYDSFGQTDWLNVKSLIRHMNLTKGIRVFYLDHLTAMADTADEKGSIEQIMKEMAGLANELNIIIHFISHLATPDGTPHEEGGRVAIRHFKGSRSIGFWSYFMFGLERNQQADDPKVRHTTVFRCLKDRYTGQSTGETLLIGYNKETGRIILPDALGFDSLDDFKEEEEF